MDTPTPPLPLPPSPAGLSDEALTKAEALTKEGASPSLPSPQFISPPIPHASKRLWLLAGFSILAAGILVGFLGTKVLNPSTNQSSLAPTQSPKDTSRFSQLAVSPTPMPDPK